MQSLKNTKVLIFGLGLNQGGVGSAKFFAKQGAKVKVTDLKDEKRLKSSLDQLKQLSNITYTLGQHKNEDIDWADLTIKNPAVKPGNSYIEYALKKGKQVETDMGIFLQYVLPDQIVGVTGTKGKSTTASLIYKVLNQGVKLAHPGGVLSRHAGKIKVILAGNIGKSVLDIMPQIKKDTLVILELSSFQLEAFESHQVSLKWAVITNIYPDHLNYYKSMDEYVSSKKVIGLYQNSSDFLFINKDDPILNSHKFLNGLKGRVIFYSSSDLPKDFASQLQGEHNKSNMAAAFSVGKSFNIDTKLLLKTLTSFKGIPFRMELTKVWHGIKIYNDSTATNPDASIQSIKTLASHIGSGNPNIILIGGGMNKNMPYDEYSKAVDKYAKKGFFLTGDSTDEIKRLMKRQDKIVGTYGDLDKLLNDVKSAVSPGDTILFSPAATSFNLFQNEFDRGRKFNAAADKVFK